MVQNERFPTLSGISRGVRAGSYVVIGITILAAVMVLSIDLLSFLHKLLAALLVLLGGAVLRILVLALGEAAGVALAIEENTRSPSQYLGDSSRVGLDSVSSEASSEQAMGGSPTVPRGVSAGARPKETIGELAGAAWESLRSGIRKVMDRRGTRNPWEESPPQMVHCPSCGAENPIHSARSGEQVKCRECQTPLRVPEPNP